MRFLGDARRARAGAERGGIRPEGAGADRARLARAGSRWACAAVAAIALTFAACGGDDGDNATTETAADAKAVDPAAARNAKGTVAWCIGKDTSGTFRTGIRRFEAANPGVQVNLIELPEEADEQRN